MKVAIMQPYFLPYLGYFQLIHAVDVFVLYDDAHFIKGGWINRNYMLGQGGRQLMTVPLRGASQNKLINQIQLVGAPHKLLKSIRQNYAKAPCFDAVFPLVENLLTLPERNLANFLDICLRRVCTYLGLTPNWQVASEIPVAADLRGQDRILALCEALGASHYINLPGGRMLYDPAAFAKRGMQLSFLEPGLATYRQFGTSFTAGLSILDVMMFNDSACCQRLLQEYRLA